MDTQARQETQAGFRVVMLDFFGTLARATHSIDIGAVVARHGYTLSEEATEMWWSGDIDGEEHEAASASRDHYVAWQEERLLAMLATADVHPGEYEQILADLHAGRAERVMEVYAEVPAVLAELRDRGLHLAVCSNWDWDLDPAIEEVGLAGTVDTVMSSAWAGARKPHPRIFERTLEQVGAHVGDLTPAEVLFVGDTWGPDVEGPLASGMRPAYLERDGHWPDATLPPDAPGADVVPRLLDLRGVLDLV
ncbi:MAG: HAD family hydrolase [Acidimicrobiia bacterium]